MKLKRIIAPPYWDLRTWSNFDVALFSIFGSKQNLKYESNAC